MDFKQSRGKEINEYMGQCLSLMTPSRKETCLLCGYTLSDDSFEQGQCSLWRKMVCALVGRTGSFWNSISSKDGRLFILLGGDADPLGRECSWKTPPARMVWGQNNPSAFHSQDPGEQLAPSG